MLKEKALYYYKKGYNCSQCILKACEQVYNVPVSNQSIKLCSAVNTGFGVGSICSVLVAGIMFFGILFDDATAKRLRIKLLTKFQGKHSINCMSLKKEIKNNGGCDIIVCEIAGIIEEIINEEKGI